MTRIPGVEHKCFLLKDGNSKTKIVQSTAVALRSITMQTRHV